MTTLDNLKGGWFRDNLFNIINILGWSVVILLQFSGWAVTRTYTDKGLQDQIDSTIKAVQSHVQSDDLIYARKNEVNLQFSFITQQLNDIKESLRKGVK